MANEIIVSGESQTPGNSVIQAGTGILATGGSGREGFLKTAIRSEIDRLLTGVESTGGMAGSRHSVIGRQSQVFRRDRGVLIPNAYLFRSFDLADTFDFVSHWDKAKALGVYSARSLQELLENYPCPDPVRMFVTEEEEWSPCSVEDAERWEREYTYVRIKRVTEERQGLEGIAPETYLQMHHFKQVEFKVILDEVLPENLKGIMYTEHDETPPLWSYGLQFNCVPLFEDGPGEFGHIRDEWHYDNFPALARLHPNSHYRLLYSGGGGRGIWGNGCYPVQIKELEGFYALLSGIPTTNPSSHRLLSQ